MCGGYWKSACLASTCGDTFCIGFENPRSRMQLCHEKLQGDFDGIGGEDILGFFPFPSSMLKVITMLTSSLRYGLGTHIENSQHLTLSYMCAMSSIALLWTSEIVSTIAPTGRGGSWKRSLWVMYTTLPLKNCLTPLESISGCEVLLKLLRQKPEKQPLSKSECRFCYTYWLYQDLVKNRHLEMAG